MKLAATILVASLTTLAFPGSAGDCIVVDTDRIYAADLARAHPAFQDVDPGIPIGYAPLPGLKRVFTTAQLQRLLRRHGVDEPGGDRLCVERETVLLSEPKLREAIEDAAGPDITLDILDFSRKPVPPGELQFDLSGLRIPLTASPDTPVLWRGRVAYGQRKSVPVWARVRISKPAQQVVAVRDLSAGETIGSADVEVRIADVFPTVDPPIDEIEAVVGATLRRSVRNGAPLHRAELRLPNDVERGQIIRVEVTSGTAYIRFDGRAETAGRRGDRILVENPASRKRFSAVVAGPSHAIVRLDRDVPGDI